MSPCSASVYTNPLTHSAILRSSLLLGNGPMLTCGSPTFWDLRRGRWVSSDSLLHVFERPRSEPVPSIRTYSSINPLSHFPIHLRVLGNVGPMLMCGSPQVFSLPRPPHSRSSVRAFRAALCCPPTSYEELSQSTWGTELALPQ